MMASAESGAIDETIVEKLTKYEHFVNEVLKNDLKNVLKRQEMVCKQIADYLQIKSVINGIEDKSLIESNNTSPLCPLKVQTDIGSNFYVESVIPNPNKIFLLIGMGFYVELTLAEALQFIDKKEKLLNEELNQLSKQSIKIKANIKLIIHTIAQISGL